MKFLDVVHFFICCLQLQILYSLLNMGEIFRSVSQNKRISVSCGLTKLNFPTNIRGNHHLFTLIIQNNLEEYLQFSLPNSFFHHPQMNIPKP
jgi:hypothetical protein